MRFVAQNGAQYRVVFGLIDFDRAGAYSSAQGIDVGAQALERVDQRTDVSLCRARAILVDQRFELVALVGQRRDAEDCGIPLQRVNQTLQNPQLELVPGRDRLDELAGLLEELQETGAIADQAVENLDHFALLELQPFALGRRP